MDASVEMHGLGTCWAKRLFRYSLRCLVVLGVGFAHPVTIAAPIATLGDAVVLSLETNPAVVGAYYDFEAAREAQRDVQGDLGPRVDVEADYGREDRRTPLNDFGRYTRDSARLKITQLLFDGFETRDKARALRYQKLARYYDVHRVAQEVALEAIRAYTDVVLYQALTGFAEENYVFHRQTYNKIAERVFAGRDERVNLEQATSRMALAESNLLTEVTNLHDTRAELQRVTGELPIDTLPMPTLPKEVIPSVREYALAMAYQRSPRVNRAIEEMRAAREELNSSRGLMYPRLDLRYRNEQENNIDGFRGDYDLEAVELVLTYNIFRSGGDSAKRRQLANRYYSATEARKQACLDVRREVMIAFNNVRALEQQVKFLDVQLDAQGKTRIAYEDQFDRNQRTLLDLLDSQNEFFDTQRALYGARAELVKAYAKILAELGVLTDAMDVQGFNADKLEQVSLDLARRDDEQIPECTAGMVGEISIDKEAIFERLDSRAAASQ